MKKKYILLLIIPVVVFCAVLAIKKNNGQKKSKETVNGESVFSNGFYCFDDRGLLYFDSEFMLKFVDATSGQETFVCSNANCPHTRTGFSDLSCAASSATGMIACLMSDDKIYVLGNYKDKEQDMGSFGIYEEELDGTNVKKLYTIKSPDTVPVFLMDAWLKDGRICLLYRNSTDYSDENNPIDLDIPLSGFYVYNIAENEAFCINAPTYEAGGNLSADINHVFINENHVYFDVYYGLSDNKSVARVYDYDMEKKTEEKVAELEDVFVHAIDEKGFIYSTVPNEDSERTIGFYDLEEGNQKELSVGGVAGSFSYGDKYFYSVSNKRMRQWYCYERGGEPARIGDAIEGDFKCTVGDKVFYISYIRSDSGEIIGKEVFTLSMEDFEKGDFGKMQKIYSKED